MLVAEPAIGAQAIGEQHQKRLACLRAIEMGRQMLLLPQLANRFRESMLDVGQLRQMRLHAVPPLAY